MPTSCRYTSGRSRYPSTKRCRTHGPTHRGDAQRRQPIFLGPYWDTVQVTNNCAAAIRRLRQEHAPRLLWVDAVCIDQDNAAERSAQVERMRFIYWRAAAVLVYLGGDDEFGDSHLALELLAQKDYTEIFGLAPGWAAAARPGGQPKSVAGCSNTALSRLLARPYFQRLWVVQEFVAATAVSVFCGGGFAPWPLSGLDAARGECGRQVAPWVRYRQLSLRISSDDLWKIFLDTAECLCADPRDKVFAVLGLVRRWNSKSIMADYTRSVEEVYIGIAAYLGQASGRFGHVLGLAAARRSTESRYRLPSWVPDWTDGATCVERFRRQRQAYYRLVAANARVVRFHPPSGSGVVNIRSDNGSLQVQATKLCIVRDLFVADHSEECFWAYRGEWLDPSCRVRLVLPHIPLGDRDGLFWLHGIKGHAVLRPADDTGRANYSLVAVCNLLFMRRKIRPSPSPNLTPATTQLSSTDPGPLCGEINASSSSPVPEHRQVPTGTIRAFSPTEKRTISDHYSVEQLRPRLEQSAAGPDEETFQYTYRRLLGALACISAGLVSSELALWKAWMTMNDELSWVTQDQAELNRLIVTIKALTVSPVESGGKSTFLDDKGVYISGSVVASVAKFAWWKQRASGSVIGWVSAPASRPDDQGGSSTSMLSKFVEWADVTENLLRVVQKISTVMGAGDNADVLALDLSEQWNRSWRELVVQAGDPECDEEYPSKELAASLLELLLTRALGRPQPSGHFVGQAGLSDADSPSGVTALTEVRPDLIWDESCVLRVMNTRAALWEEFGKLDKERRWSMAMFRNSPRLSELDEQIVARAELRTLGMTPDDAEQIFVQ